MYGAASEKRTPQNSSLPLEHPASARLSAAAQSQVEAYRGGQPGHTKHQRQQISREQCHRVETGKPAQGRRWGDRLSGDAPTPLRPQVFPMSRIKLTITANQRRRLVCPPCGDMPCGQLSPGVPEGPLGAMFGRRGFPFGVLASDGAGALLGGTVVARGTERKAAQVRSRRRELSAHCRWLRTYLCQEGFEPRRPHLGWQADVAFCPGTVRSAAADRSCRLEPKAACRFSEPLCPKYRADRWERLSFGTQIADGRGFVERCGR